MSFINPGLFVFFSLLSISSCTSPSIQINDSKWEEPLREISGLDQERFDIAKSRDRYNLIDLYALALESSERLAIRYEKVRQAEARKTIAFSAFLPSITYRNQRTEFLPDTSEARQKEEQRNFAYNSLGLPAEYYPLVSGGSTGSLNLPPTFRSGQRLVLRIPIFSGISNFTAYNSVKSEIQLRKLEMSQESRLLLTDLAQNYFSILLFEKVLAQRKESLKITASLLKEYTRRVSLGLAKSSELNLFQTRIFSLEAEILTLEEQINAGRERLHYLSSLPEGFILTDDLELSSPNYDLAEALKCLENRPDVRVAKSSVEISKSNALGAKSDFLPNVFIDGIYNFRQGNSGESLFAQFIFEIPLFNGGRTLAQIQESESIQKESELNLKLVVRSGTEEIKKAYSAFSRSLGELESYKKALEYAEKGHKLILQDFAYKRANSLEVLNSLVSLNQTRESFERASIQNRLNRFLLGLSVGEFPVGAENWKEKKEDNHNSR